MIFPSRTKEKALPVKRKGSIGKAEKRNDKNPKKEFKDKKNNIYDWWMYVRISYRSFLSRSSKYAGSGLENSTYSPVPG